MVRTKEYNMSVDEKMKVIRNSVEYARGGNFNCLSCLNYMPKDAEYKNQFGKMGNIHVRGPSQSEVRGLVDAIKEIGLNPEKVDKFFLEEGIKTDLFYGQLYNCVDVDKYLKNIEKLIKNEEQTR